MQTLPSNLKVEKHWLQVVKDVQAEQPVEHGVHEFI